MIKYKESFTSKFPSYIHSYTSSIGTIKESQAKLITRAFPTHLTQLLFEFCGDLSLTKSENTTTNITKRTYVNAGVGKWMDIFQLSSSKSTRDVKNFKVELYPHTLYEVFNMSPNELINCDVNIEDIWTNKDDLSQMLEELALAKDASSMITTFEHFFLKQILNVKRKNNYTHLFLNPYNNLDNLSKKLGYSKRWIQIQHKDIFGLSFKELQKNMRFLKTIDHIDKAVLENIELNLSLIAYEFGYYDQAHFIKEFKYYTGLTPTTYIKTKFKYQPKFYW